MSQHGSTHQIQAEKLLITKFIIASVAGSADKLNLLAIANGVYSGSSTLDGSLTTPQILIIKIA